MVTITNENRDKINKYCEDLIQYFKELNEPIKKEKINDFLKIHGLASTHFDKTYLSDSSKDNDKNYEYVKSSQQILDNFHNMSLQKKYNGYYDNKIAQEFDLESKSDPDSDSEKPKPLKKKNQYKI